ncbi:MAG: bifunctional glutamate N-acetyltransferase/amino-acid acetyltransferase ArgJ [Defluviitaleaceae bacterium]|nr:bifunctional glutamate N-acetyltransferase/amino-acid acetyltransferase ArgJ [Defluviitaleaceae bacterium]
MHTIKIIPGGVTAPPGFLASGIHCGIRRNKSKRDLALILADRPCAAAAVCTTNIVKAAPVNLTIEHLKDGNAQAILVNSGNANACAPGGMEAAQECVNVTAAALGLTPSDIIVNSTGVIGQQLPTDTITSAIPELVSALSKDSDPAAEAIMTTDTFSKSVAVQCEIGGKAVTIGGIAKGSGMIHPNMATMLAFLTTDCDIAPDMLKAALQDSANRTYNRISVDGDTSTNDMTAILASGAAGNPKIIKKDAYYDVFLEALNTVNLYLAKKIAKDGEGATKLITCRVSAATDEEKAAVLAKSVISSSLVKSMIFGADANVGRVLCAMGYSGAKFDVSKVDIGFSSKSGQVSVCKQGLGLGFDEDLAKKVLSRSEIVIEISLNEGNAVAEAYGCDLTYDYVRINGDYRS